MRIQAGPADLADQSHGPTRRRNLMYELLTRPKSVSLYSLLSAKVNIHVMFASRHPCDGLMGQDDPVLGLTRTKSPNFLARPP